MFVKLCKQMAFQPAKMGEADYLSKLVLNVLSSKSFDR